MKGLKVWGLAALSSAVISMILSFVFVAGVSITAPAAYISFKYFLNTYEKNL